MAALKVLGHVDSTHRLIATLPESIAPGTVEIIVMVPDDGEPETAWQAAVARAWEAELSDPREDLYTLTDGEPIDGSR